jgi:hypothetical protein
VLSSISAHPDVIPEQKYIDRAYECLSAMRARTLRLSDKELAGSTDDSALVQDRLSYRLSSLEFDAVIVVEPSEIFEQTRSGPRLLYVAMTRAVPGVGSLKRLPALLDVA